MIKHYLKVALRSLWTYRTHSLISVLCLAVGITFFVLISHLINVVTSKHDLPRAEEKIRFAGMKGDSWQSLNWQDVCFLQSQQIVGIDSLFAALIFTQDAEVTLFDSNQKEYPLLTKYKTASPNCFACAGYELLEGNRTLGAQDEVIVSENFVRRTLGNQSPIGLVLRVDVDFRMVPLSRISK